MRYNTASGRLSKDGLSQMEEQVKTYNTRELLKADVVELASGSVVGRVVEAVVNTRSGAVEYLGVRPVQWHKPGALLKTSDIIGFDESVLLVSSESVLAAYNPKIHEKHTVTCSELRTLILLDHEGHVLGNPTGCFFSPDGKIVAFEAEKDLVVHVVHLGRIVGVGERYFIVDTRISQAPPSYSGIESPSFPLPDEQAAAAHPLFPKADAGDNGGNGDLAAKYRERQIQYILGKISPLTLSGKNGSPIISMGEIITSSVVSRLVEEGELNQVFIALTVSNGRVSANEAEMNPE
jgi:uncharacterized protein YrrD